MSMTEEQAVAIATLETQIEVLEKKLEEATIHKREASGDTSFEQHVQEICKRDGCSPLMAMAKARKEFPADFERYQKADPVDRMSLPLRSGLGRMNLPSRSRLGDDAQDFENLVSQIQTARGLKRVDAMVAARKENPLLYQAYNAAAG